MTENTAESLKKHLLEKQTAKFLEKRGYTEIGSKKRNYSQRGSRNQTSACDGGRRGPYRRCTDIANSQTTKQLKQDESLTIIQADKGNATVIINTGEYKQKIKMLLEPSTYVTRQRDPTSSVLRETNKLVRASSLPDDVKKQVIVTEALRPRLYGLPKIRKRDIPFRPIVSAIGAPTYLLAKYLTALLQPYIGEKPSYIRNSALFVEKLRKIRFNPGDILVSFDVVSFTKVPLVATLRYIAELFPPDITNLFKHYLRTSYFV
ncbi:hypothetical protein Trydic_g22595 [Trypoxylus dichotomus]